MRLPPGSAQACFRTQLEPARAAPRAQTF